MQIIPRGDRTRLEIDVVGIRDGADWQPASGRATLLVDGHLLGIHAGDRVRIFGQLASPSAARNPGEFDFAQHARADRQRSVLRSEYPDCVSVVDRASGLTPWQLLDALRTGGEGQLWRYLDVRHAGLATALLLGDREELGAKQTAGFQETGTAHLLAISGLNIGIVVLTLAWLLRMARVPPVRAAVILAVVAVGYTILTDAQPPVVRAMILVLVWTASQLLRRRALPFNALAAAGLVVLALNPAELFRVGTQLSFLAVAGLMWLAPAWFGTQADPLDQLVEETRPWLSRSIRRSVRSARHLTLVSAAIWALALPLVMARFHLFSLVAIPLNTLLWLPVGAALVSGYALLALGWLCPPVGVVAAWVCNISLWAIDAGIDLARAVPLGHVWVPGPPEWWLVGFYGALGFFAAVPRLRPPRRWAVALLAGMERRRVRRRENVRKAAAGMYVPLRRPRLGRRAGVALGQDDALRRGLLRFAISRRTFDRRVSLAARRDARGRRRALARRRRPLQRPARTARPLLRRRRLRLAHDVLRRELPARSTFARRSPRRACRCANFARATFSTAARTAGSRCSIRPAGASSATTTPTASS